MERIIFNFVWSGLLLVPPFTVGIFILTRRLCPIVQPGIFKATAACLILTLAFVILKIGFTDSLANFICLIITYFSYCFVSLSLCWRITNKIIRIFALIGAAIPVGIGYILGTIGLLGLMFKVGDYTRPPSHTEQMRSGLVCEITEWGWAGSDEGNIVRLYKFWPSIPFIRKEVASINVDYTAGESDASCADALSKFAN